VGGTGRKRGRAIAVGSTVACGHSAASGRSETQETIQQVASQQGRTITLSKHESPSLVPRRALGARTPPCVTSSIAEPLTPTTLIQSMEDRLCLPLQTPLLQGPPKLRKPKTPAPTLLRRSARLARTPREPDCTVQARVVLLKKLGLQPPENPLLGS